MRPEPILLLTRPEQAARRFLARLPDDWPIRPLISPLLKIVPCADHIDTGAARAVILTSANGVAGAVRLNVSRELPVVTVGEATARAARNAGWSATCAGKNADELVAALTQSGPTGPFLHLHGQHRRGDIAARLTAAGLPTEGQAIYNQVAQPLSDPAMMALSGETTVIAPIFSPRTAALFAKLPDISAPLVLIAFSPAVAQELRASGVHKPHMCPEPTEEAMRAALCDVIQALCRVEGP